jgi:hypothetical protein
MSDLTPRKPHDADDEPTAQVNPSTGDAREQPEPAPVSAVAGSTPGAPDPAAPEPEPTATAAAAPAAPVTASPAGPARERWYRRRVPVLAAFGALLLGGLIGGGVVAIGAFAAGDHRGDDRGQHGPRFARDGGDRAEGRGGDRFERRGEARREGREERRRGREGDAPAPSGSAGPASPAPSASS